jgi:phage terminase large subunit GpA-like protein
MHFPVQYDERYFKQLTAEVLEIKYRRGFPIRQWRKVNDRNEALDIRVYNLAAYLILTSNEAISEVVSSRAGEED